MLLLSALGVRAPAAAQDVAVWDDQIPAHVAVVDGPATLERDGVIEALALNTVLVAGDRMRTDQGRAEVIFGDGTVLDIDAYSSVDMLSESLMRLLEGRVKLTVARGVRAAYRIDGAGGSAVIRAPGEYRIAVGDARQAEQSFEVMVHRGSAELRNALGTTLVRPGTYAVSSASTVPSLPYASNSAAWDEFEAWASEQRDARLGYASAQYLPADLRYYGGMLDRSGSWDYVDGYGDVWYPHVGSGWYPYSHGSWTFVGHFGWTWVGADLWAWPTHHYGRWGHHRNRWFWIPGRHWSPAWVTWVSAPGYIAWSPIGFDNRPLVSITTVSVHIGPRLGWSVVPATHWQRRVHVPSVAVPHNRLRADLWGQFAVRRGGPEYAVPRGERAVAGSAVNPVPVAPAPSARAVSREGPRATTGTAPSRAPSTARPRSTTPAQTAGRAVRPSASAAAVAPPARSSPRDGQFRPSPTDRPAAMRRQAPPASPPAASGSAGPRARQPDVTYYRGGNTSAAPAAPPSGAIRSAPSAPPPGRSVESARPRVSQPAPRSGATRSAPSAPPSGRSIESARPRVSQPAPRSGATRSAPSAPPSGRSIESARPRVSQPAPRSGGGRPSSPGVQRAAPPNRSAAPAPTAQPNRGGGRTAPPGTSGRGSARPRGGG
jgi:hypothetical protein